jgi:hypothetical protein
MDEWTGIAYGAFGISSFISALRIGRWILNADPRAIINVGRWSSICLTVLSLGVLLWLVVNGRRTHAMLLAAFILPVLVQAAPRWRLLLGPLNVLGGDASAIAPDLSQGTQPGNCSGMRGSIDPELVKQCAAVLKAYLERTSAPVGYTPKGISFERRSANGSTNDSGRRRMSVEEARDVLGLDFSARPYEINEAHRRLGEKFDPELGGTQYLIMKINEARDVLLGE